MTYAEESTIWQLTALVCVVVPLNAIGVLTLTPKSSLVAPLPYVVDVPVGTISSIHTELLPHSLVDLVDP